MDMSLCLEASDVCAVNEGDCGWVWEWRAGHFGMCSSWPRKWPGGLCLLLESLWTWALPTSLGKLRPKALSNAEFSTDKLEWSLLNSADGVIVWDVESDLQLFLFRDVDRSKVFIDFFFFFFGWEACGIKPTAPILEGEVFTTGPPGNLLPATWKLYPECFLKQLGDLAIATGSSSGNDSVGIFSLLGFEFRTIRALWILACFADLSLIF